jgi:hypothetical protein
LTFSGKAGLAVKAVSKTGLNRSKEFHRGESPKEERGEEKKEVKRSKIPEIKESLSSPV